MELYSLHANAKSFPKWNEEQEYKKKKKTLKENWMSDWNDWMNERSELNVCYLTFLETLN